MEKVFKQLKTEEHFCPYCETHHLLTLVETEEITRCNNGQYVIFPVLYWRCDVLDVEWENLDLVYVNLLSKKNACELEG